MGAVLRSGRHTHFQAKDRAIKKKLRAVERALRPLYLAASASALVALLAGLAAATAAAVAFFFVVAAGTAWDAWKGAERGN